MCLLLLLLTLMWMQLVKLWSFPFFIRLSVTSYSWYYLVCMVCNQAQQGYGRALKADTHRFRTESFDTARVGIHVVTTGYCRYATAIKYELIATWSRGIAFLRAYLFVICLSKNHAAFYLDISAVLQFSIPVYVGKNSPFRCDCVKGKAVPLQAWSGPEGSKKLRFPDFM